MTPRPPGTASDPESPHIWLQLARVCFTFCTQTTTLAAIRGGPACSVHGQGVGGGAGGGGGGRASARSPGPRVRAAPVFVSVPPAARVSAAASTRSSSCLLRRFPHGRSKPCSRGVGVTATGRAPAQAGTEEPSGSGAPGTAPPAQLRGGPGASLPKSTCLRENARPREQT